MSEVSVEKKGMRPGTVVAIIIGAVTVIGLMIWGIISLLSSFFGVIGESVGAIPGGYFEGENVAEPLISGEPGSPRAVDPTECEDECFGYDSLHVASPSKLEFDELGLTEDYDFAPPSSVRTEHTLSARDWDVGNGSPDTCFVTQPFSPFTANIDDVPEPDRKVINFDGTHTDPLESTIFNQSVRFFANSQTAVDYMVTVRAELDACTFYEVWYSEDESWTADVTPAPALDVPDSVAAVGWVESNAVSRYYVFDLQRGNYVVRTTLLSYSGITESEFRSVMESIAVRVADMRLEK